MKILESIFNATVKHSQAELPNEACGYLAEKNEIVSKYYALTNTDKAVDHFTMDPKEQFAAIKDMRECGATLCAVYHSHPETPARPSAEDICLAFDPNISYVIISLADSEKTVVKSFRINKGIVDAEEIEIATEPGYKTEVPT